MKQECVYFHTKLNLAESNEILEQEGMQIILKTNSLYLDFEDMNEEEQKSWLKEIRGDLEDAADDVDLFYRKLKRFHSQKEEFPKNIRILIEELPQSDFVVSGQHKKIVQKLVDFEHDTRDFTYYNNYRTRDVSRFGEGIRCSCIIARQGDDIVRYLSFLRDPIISVSGANADKLKSTLEKKF